MANLSFDEITIDGFRGLRQLTLSGMGRINVLVGENNSGKTSVLEALSIACNPFDPHEWLAMVRRRDFGGLDETRIQSLRWCFPQQGELIDPDFMYEGKCEFKVSGGFPLRKLVVEYHDILGEPVDVGRRRIARQSGTGARVAEFDAAWRGAEIAHYVESDIYQPHLFPDSEMPTIALEIWEGEPVVRRQIRKPRIGERGFFSLRNETLTPYSYQLGQHQVRTYSEQFFQSDELLAVGKKQVIDLLREFEPAITDIEIASFRGRRAAIYLNHRQLGPAPLSVFGDALRRAVLLSSTLHMLKGGGLLLVDEVEAGIHISALQRVFGWLANVAKELDVQIVATTHSLEALDGIAGALGDSVNDLVTYHLDQQVDVTKSKRISGEVLRRLRSNRGLDVR